MCDEYAIYMATERVGTAYVTNEGLFYRIRCLCQLTGTVPCRITASGEGEVDLGVCVPMDDGFGIKTRVPMKKLGRCELRFCVQPKHRVRTDLFIALSPEEPFRYIQRLRDAYMSFKNGQVGLSFKDQSLIQRDSDQSP